MKLKLKTLADANFGGQLLGHHDDTHRYSLVFQSYQAAARSYVQVSSYDDTLSLGKQWRVKAKRVNAKSTAPKATFRCKISWNSDTVDAADVTTQLIENGVVTAPNKGGDVEPVAMPSCVATYNTHTPQNQDIKVAALLKKQRSHRSHSGAKSPRARRCQ